MTKYNIFLTLTILTILSQIVHTWFVFDMFSKLKGWIRYTQGIIFCGILSGAIYGFAINGDKWLALLMAVIEVAINIAYYGREYWTGDTDKRKREFSSVGAYWRMNWAAYLFAVIIPVMIFVFVEKNDPNESNMSNRPEYEPYYINEDGFRPPEGRGCLIYIGLMMVVLIAMVVIKAIG